MFDCNTYVINGTHAIIIDPGSPQFLPSLLQDLHKDGIDPGDIEIITNTHLHGDHCWANETFKELSGAKISIHPIQKEFYNVTVVETTKYFGLQPVDFKEDVLLNSSVLNAGDTEFELVHSPGHSPDSICFYCPKDKILICGDVIFEENTGRADLPGGNAAELVQSIEKLSNLEVEYLLPGHMGIVTGNEKVKNNFEFISRHILRWL
ncbi:MBL fold metallo-hydrolase [Chloroflexota bacterium]